MEGHIEAISFFLWPRSFFSLAATGSQVEASLGFLVFGDVFPMEASVFFLLWHLSWRAISGVFFPWHRQALSCGGISGGF